MIRSINCVALFLCLVQGLNTYEIPTPVVKVYPQGFEVYITHEPGISSVFFRRRLGSGVSLDGRNDWNIFTLTAQRLWIYRDLNAKLPLHDSLYYSIYVNKDERDYVARNLSYTVENYEKITNEDPGSAKNFQYNIPEPKIKIYHKGFELSIPHATGMQKVTFGAKNNANVGYPRRGHWSGKFFLCNENDRWTYRNFDAQLQLGDTINYWICVKKDERRYVELNCNYLVKYFEVTMREVAGTSDLNETPQYRIPKPIFRAYRKGFDISIPHEDGMQLFAYSACLNLKFKKTVWKNIAMPDENGSWTCENSDAEIPIGSTVKYMVVVKKNGKRYVKTNLVHVVKKYEDRTTTKASGTSDPGKISQRN